MELYVENVIATVDSSGMSGFWALTGRMLKWDSYDASGARGRAVIFPGSQDGPSKECKAFEARWGYGTPGETLVLVEEGELELPEHPFGVVG